MSGQYFEGVIGKPQELLRTGQRLLKQHHRGLDAFSSRFQNIEAKIDALGWRMTALIFDPEATIMRRHLLSLSSEKPA